MNDTVQEMFNEFDIIALVETHGLSYQSFFCPKSLPTLSVVTHSPIENSDKRGGIVIASTTYELKKIDGQFSEEFLAIEVKNKQGTVYCSIITVYIPPCGSRYISHEREYDM